MYALRPEKEVCKDEEAQAQKEAKKDAPQEEMIIWKTI